MTFRIRGGLIAGAAIAVLAAILVPAAEATTKRAGPFVYKYSNLKATPGGGGGGAVCPDPSRGTGIGGKIQGPTDLVRIVELYPTDDTDPLAIVDDGGGYEIENNSPGPFQRTRLSIICLRKAAGSAQLSYPSLTVPTTTGSGTYLAQAICGSSRLLGGGAALTGVPTGQVADSHVFRMGPYDHDDDDVADDGWQISVVLSGDPRDMKVTPICIPPEPLKIRHIEAQKQLALGQTKKIKLKCPKNFHVAAGGFRGHAALNPVASVNIDTKRDRNRTPNDAWMVRGRSKSLEGSITMVGYAICAKKRA